MNPIIRSLVDLMDACADASSEFVCITILMPPNLYNVIEAECIKRNYISTPDLSHATGEREVQLNHTYAHAVIRPAQDITKTDQKIVDV